MSTVNISISAIPPVNTTGSYYDGELRPSICVNVLLMRCSVDFVYMHMDLNVLVRIRCLVPTHLKDSSVIGKIHFTGLFLPWHRWYVAVYETALKERCGYEGSSPYWNWSMGISLRYPAHKSAHSPSARNRLWQLLQFGILRGR